MTPGSSADVTRLTALIARQRRELDRMRAQAAARSVVDMAQGMLMERLGCSPAEAAEQLARLASQAGTPLAELAAEVTGERLAGLPALDTGGLDDPGWRRLGLASAALQLAADGSEVAAALLEQALAPAGAVAVALWLTGPDGSLELAGQAGLGAQEAARWRHLPPAMDCYAQRVAREGTGLFWAAGPPETDDVPLLGRWPGGARAVVPIQLPGAATGVMEACWPGPLPDFPRPLRRQLTALAGLSARALSAADGDGPARHTVAWLYGLLDGLVESAMFAYPLREADGTVSDFQIGHVTTDFRDPAGRPARDLTGRPLLEVYPLAAPAGGLFDRAVEVLDTGEPQHLSGGISALVTDSVVAPLLDIRIAPLSGGVVIAWRPVGEVERFASLLQHAERLGRIGGWEENLLTGEVRWTDSALALFGRDTGAGPVPLAQLHTQVLADDLFDVEQFRDTLLRERRATAAAFRIVRADDDSVRQMRVFGEPVTDAAGAVASVRGAFQDVSAQYHTQVALTATRDHLASTEERAREEHRLAIRLQQAITPRSAAAPLAAAGLEVAARYRPAGPAYLGSGDWYDTVLLPSGQVLLVVGDIAGHGIDAVTGMVALRNCLRGLAITGAGPASLLGWLNQVACQLTDGIIGTAVCGLYAPAGRTLRWALAGHLPPVLVRGGVASELPAGQGLLLGADPDASYDEVTTELAPGDALLLFTDGLIERRDQSIDDAQAALLRHASRPVGAIAEYADHLLRNAASDTGDDACLVAVQVR